MKRRILALAVSMVSLLALTPASALAVDPVIPLVVTQAFSPASIPLNGTTKLTITIVNPNPSYSVAALGFNDTLPAGLSVSSGSGAACGGTLTRTAPTALVLANGSLATGRSCTLSVTVTGTAAGSYLTPANPLVVTSNLVSGFLPPTQVVVVAPTPAPTPKPSLTPAPTPSPTPSLTPAPTPSNSPVASESAPEASVSASASAAASVSPSSPATPGGATGGDSNTLPLVALGVVGGLGLVGLLLAMFMLGRRRGTQSGPPSGT